MAREFVERWLGNTDDQTRANAEWRLRELLEAAIVSELVYLAASHDEPGIAHEHAWGPRQGYARVVALGIAHRWPELVQVCVVCGAAYESTLE